VTILMAEDDDGHAVLIQSALRDAGLINPVVRFSDGQEILDFLEGPKGVPAIQQGQAFLLLLDINMPRVDGVEVLNRIKADPVLKNLPVIMLTTTDDPREIKRCYELGCNWYVTKPVDFRQFMKTLNSLGLFLQVVEVPPLAIEGGKG
jgi:CheY-like chemotaxis protein